MHWTIKCLNETQGIWGVWLTIYDGDAMDDAMQYAGFDLSLDKAMEECIDAMRKDLNNTFAEAVHEQVKT